MSIFNWFLKGKDLSESEKQVTIDNLKPEIASIIKEKYSRKNQEFESSRKKIVSSFQKILSEVEALETAPLKEDKIDPKLKVHVRSAKENLSKILKSVCRNYLEKTKTISEVEQIPAMMDLTRTSIEELNRTAKHSEIAAIYFNKQVNSIGNCIKAMIELYKEISDNYESSGVEKLLFAEKKVNEMLELLKYRQSIISQTKEQKKGMEDTLEEIAVIEQQKKDMENSNEYKTAKAIEKKISDLQAERNHLKIVLRNKFSVFQKPLLKMKASLSLSSEEESIIKMYLEEPFNAIDIDQNLRINQILKRAMPIIKEESTYLEPRLKIKLTEEIENFLEKEEFRKVMEKKKELSTQIKDADEDLKKSGVFKFNFLEVKARDAEKKAMDLKTAVSVQERLLEKNFSGIRKLKEDITKNLSEIGIKIRII